MMNCLQSWPEPVVRVQSLAASGIRAIPERYIKPPSHRPLSKNDFSPPQEVNIPVIDFQNVFSDDQRLRDEALRDIYSACHEWGFFQVVNHGVSHELMKRTSEVWREFFNLPVEVKQEYANTPATYEGYGSRLGVEKGAILDWSDYFFLNYMPVSLRNQNKWPATPASCRRDHIVETNMREYQKDCIQLGCRTVEEKEVGSRMFSQRIASQVQPIVPSFT